jgi:outer membrane cobalamin receptor
VKAPGRSSSPPCAPRCEPFPSLRLSLFPILRLSFCLPFVVAAPVARAGEDVTVPAAAAGRSVTIAEQQATTQKAPPTDRQRFEETVVVTGSAEPVRLLELGRSLDALDGRRIAELPVRSLDGALRLMTGAEVRARGEGGTQADFSLRGGAFGQTLVLVDGVRLNDSQTGHHNGDIPVPLDDVERIEVLAGPGSSLYGADALGGVIQIVTRESGPRLQGRLAGGSAGFADGAISARVAGGGVAAALSLSAQRSGGFLLPREPGARGLPLPEDTIPDLRASDRDYRVLSGRARLSAGRNTRLTLSHVDKGFGALGFYGPAPSREWTTQSLAALDHSFSAGRRLGGSLQLFARAHSDHFLYDRRNPSLSENRHRSRSLGAALRLHRAFGGLRLSAGAEAGADWVASTNLGDHGFGRASLFAEGEGRWGPVVARPGLRLDAYGRFGSALSPSLALAGPLHTGLRWRASAGRAFRVPTFTELYYHDPNNLGSPDLRPESAWGGDAGLDLDLGRTGSASLTVFDRRETNVIDWVRPSTAERWQTENIRDVATHGVEASAREPLGPIALRARYAWLESSAPTLTLQSKYVLDFARHVFGLDLSAQLPGALRLAPTLEYRRKVDGRDWWRLDVRLARPLGRLELFADGRNLLDERYQEVIGAAMPGRSLALGLRLALR